MASNLCGGASASFGEQACREPEVHGSIDRLRCSNDELETALSVLFDRLHAVLSPAPPVSGDNAKEIGFGSPLAESIQVQCRRLQQLLVAVREVTTRLEI